jgi:hypothetical protein
VVNPVAGALRDRNRFAWENARLAVSRATIRCIAVEATMGVIHRFILLTRLRESSKISIARSARDEKANDAMNTPRISKSEEFVKRFSIVSLSEKTKTAKIRMSEDEAIARVKAMNPINLLPVLSWNKPGNSRVYGETLRSLLLSKLIESPSRDCSTFFGFISTTGTLVLN